MTPARELAVRWAKRISPLAFLPLTAAAPPPTPLDVNETGRVLATLDDWRAITFALIVLIFLQLIERLWSGREARLERKALIDTLDKMRGSIDSAIATIATFSSELFVFRALSSRIESRLENRDD